MKPFSRSSGDSSVGDRRGDSDRRTFITFATMLAGIILVTTLGATVVEGVSTQLDQPDIESLAATAPPASTDMTPGATQAPTDADDAAPNSTQPPTSTTGESSNPALRTIQLVPPVRDVIVEIDGRELLSDSNGLIRIENVSSDAEFEFVGVRAQPSLRQVSFDRWSDGNREPVRHLADIDGPTTQVGLVLDHRVTVSTTEEVSNGTEIGFLSQAGYRLLTVGTSTWIPAAHAVETPDGLSTQQYSYAPDRLVANGVESRVEHENYAPDPESLWTVTIAL